MIEPIKSSAEGKMKKAIEALQNELTKLRTGRAHTSLLDHVRVAYYGNEVPLNQVASVSVSDARTLVVTPWEKNMMSAVEKAIQTSELGLNPTPTGQMLRIPLPPLTEERRREMAKLVKNALENARVSIRNARRDANNQIKDLVKQKKMGEDEEARVQDLIQNSTDKYIAEADRIAQGKEKEIMEI